MLLGTNYNLVVICLMTANNIYIRYVLYDFILLIFLLHDDMCYTSFVRFSGGGVQIWSQVVARNKNLTKKYGSGNHSGDVLFVDELHIFCSVLFQYI